MICIRSNLLRYLRSLYALSFSRSSFSSRRSWTISEFFSPSSFGCRLFIIIFNELVERHTLASFYGALISDPTRNETKEFWVSYVTAGTQSMRLLVWCAFNSSTSLSDTHFASIDRLLQQAKGIHPWISMDCSLLTSQAWDMTSHLLKSSTLFF